MENDMANKNSEKLGVTVDEAAANTRELAKEIERLQEQVRHAEVHGGQTDTCHHEMLKRALEAPKE
jgi:hypothetical protein